MARVTNKDLDKSVVTINKNKKIDKDIKTVLYDKAGNPQEYLPEDQIAIKVVEKAKNTDYMIKVDNAGAIIDFFDKDAVNEAYRLGRVNGREPYDFKKVTKTVFSYYLQYLQTKDRLYLEQANRGQ